MRIAIVEDMVADSHHLITIINNYYAKHPYILGDDSVLISVFKDQESFHDSFQENFYDLVFLDIYLSSQSNGYDIARQIRNGRSNPKVPIIFTTSSRDYAVESYEVNALSYLLKPITPQALEKCLNKLHAKPIAEGHYITVLSNRTHIRIPVSSILYIVANGNGSSIVCQSTTIITSMTIEHLQNEIDSNDFLLAKRGHLVNLNYVTDASETAFTMSDGQQTPLKVKGAKKILKIYTEYTLKELPD